MKGVKFLRGNEVWTDTFSSDDKRLYEAGYSVGGYLIDDGPVKYVLYRVNENTHERVHEFDSREELDNMVKLLLPPEDLR